MGKHDQPVAWAGPIPVVPAPRELDITNAGQFGRMLSCCLDRGGVRMVVDLSGTTFCDMAGMRELTCAHQRALAGGGEARFVIRHEIVLRVLAITGMDEVLPIFASVIDALTFAPAPFIKPCPATRVPATSGPGQPQPPDVT